MFDFLDEENDNENSGYVIDDDKKADWALEKIRQEREERDRLINLAKDKIDYYKQEIEKIESRCETSTSYLQSKLAAYFETVIEKPQWGEFKKITELTADGDIINTETGEVLGFIKAAKKPDEFRVMTD